MSAEAESGQRSSRRGLVIQIILLALLLLVTPYVSWRYLSEGLEYRKSNLQGLSDLGSFPKLHWMSLEGDTLKSSDWTDHLGLVALSESPGLASDLEDPLARIREQFQDRPDVGIYHFVPALGQQDSLVKSFPVGLTSLDSAQFASLQGFLVGLPDFTSASQPVILVDRAGRVRKVFDVSKHSDLQYLARVVAILLPPKKVEKPVLKREVEK